MAWPEGGGGLCVPPLRSVRQQQARAADSKEEAAVCSLFSGSTGPVLQKEKTNTVKLLLKKKMHTGWQTRGRQSTIFVLCYA